MNSVLHINAQPSQTIVSSHTPPKANNLKSNHLIRVSVQSSVSGGQRGRTQTALTRVLWKQRPTWGKLGVKAVSCRNIQTTDRIRQKRRHPKQKTAKSLRQHVSSNLEVRSVQQQKQFPLIVLQRSVLELLCQLTF